MRAALDGVATLLRQRLDDLRAAGHHPAQAILGGGGDPPGLAHPPGGNPRPPPHPRPRHLANPAGAALLAAATTA